MIVAFHSGTLSHYLYAAPVRYITVIYPLKDASAAPALKARFLEKSFRENGLRLEVTAGGKKYRLEYTLPQPEI